ncbi:MAG: TRAP transporter large permease [Thermodesulfobacteriota bacterium]
MDPILLSSLAIVAMFVLIVLHVPIGLSMATAGVIGFAFMSSFNAAASLLASETVTAISSLELAVVPLFLLMGNFANAAGISEDFFNLAYALLGRWRGGLAMSTVLGNGLFGAVCGSSFAATATFGRVALPQMRKRGYAATLAAGCIAAGGTLSSLIPPSVIMVIYAIMTEQFIVDLFVAAILPGILTIIAYILAIIIYVRLDPSASPIADRQEMSDIVKLALKSWSSVLLIAIIACGIYGGVFTVTEAAALGAILAFLFAIFRKKMTWSVFWQSLSDTAANSAMIYMIIIGAFVLNYFMVITHMPEVIATGIIESGWSVVLTFTVLLFVYIILGSIFDTIAAMLITLPFVTPIIDAMGYSLVWWGIVNVVIIEIGLITPPIGMNVFVLHGVAKDVSLPTIFRGIVPFLIAEFVMLTLLMIFPGISTGLLTFFR